MIIKFEIFCILIKIWNFKNYNRTVELIFLEVVCVLYVSECVSLCAHRYMCIYISMCVMGVFFYSSSSYFSLNLELEVLVRLAGYQPLELTFFCPTDPGVLSTVPSCLTLSSCLLSNRFTHHTISSALRWMFCLLTAMKESTLFLKDLRVEKARDDNGHEKNMIAYTVWD